MTLKLPKRREINRGLVKVADRAAFSIPRDRPFSKRGYKGPGPKMDWDDGLRLPKPSHNHCHLSCCRLFVETLFANPSTWLVKSRLLQYKTLESHILVRTMFFCKAARKHVGCSHGTSFWLSDCQTPSSVPKPVLTSLILAVILMFFTVNCRSLPFQLLPVQRYSHHTKAPNLP